MKRDFSTLPVIKKYNGVMKGFHYAVFEERKDTGTI